MRICELRDNIFCRRNWYMIVLGSKMLLLNHAFYKAVLWGSQKKITVGYTSGPKKGNFGINDNCTRGQVPLNIYKTFTHIESIP